MRFISNAGEWAGIPHCVLFTETKSSLSDVRSSGARTARLHASTQIRRGLKDTSEKRHSTIAEAFDWENQASRSPMERIRAGRKSAHSCSSREGGPIGPNFNAAWWRASPTTNPCHSPGRRPT